MKNEIEEMIQKNVEAMHHITSMLNHVGYDLNDVVNLHIQETRKDEDILISLELLYASLSGARSYTNTAQQTLNYLLRGKFLDD